MAAKQWTALFFVGIMAFAGCLGATEPAPEQPDDTPTTYSLDVSWTLAPETVQLGETVTYLLSVNQFGEGEYQPDVSVISPSFSRVELVEWTEQDNGYQLAFTPEIVGEFIVSVGFTNIGSSTMEPQLQPLVLVLSVEPPAEQAPILSTSNRLVLEEPNVTWFEGSVTHQSIPSCTVVYEITDGTVGNLALEDDGAWKVLLDFTEASSSHTITTTATCGQFTVLSDVSTTQVIIEGAGDDTDGDGVQNANDRCPDGFGADEGWQSTLATDADEDGCRDNDEDDDDDNDGIIDQHDGCPTSFGWVSTPSADYDYDGCHDADEDVDDDNDGVEDEVDLCPVGRKGWYSNRYSDWDNDGCSDLDEDDNDDNDDHPDGDDMSKGCCILDINADIGLGQRWLRRRNRGR